MLPSKARKPLALATMCVLSLGLLLLAAPGAGARKRNPCRPKGAKVLAKSTAARIFTVTQSSDVLSASTVFGCRNGSRRRTTLGAYAIGASVDGSADHATLAGRFAAVVITDDDCFVTVRVADLRSRHVRKVPSFPDTSSCWNVSTLVLGRRGAVGWIARGDNSGDLPAVRALDSDSSGARTLEHLAGIDPTSLALSASERVLYWTRGGAPRSAPLS